MPVRKRYYHGLKILGYALCLWDVSKTGINQVYEYDNGIYFKPRHAAARGQTINNISNLVKAVPGNIGKKRYYIETD